MSVVYKNQSSTIKVGYLSFHYECYLVMMHVTDVILSKCCLFMLYSFYDFIKFFIYLYKKIKEESKDDNKPCLQIIYVV